MAKTNKRRQSKPPKVTRGAETRDAETAEASAQHETDAAIEASRRAGYRLDPNFILDLHGHWETGGVLEFLRDTESLDCVRLPPASWAIMATLFLAGIRSESAHWLGGYVATKRLVAKLDELHLSAYPTGQTVYRLINEIRSKLGVSRARQFTGNGELSPKDWAERLLETNGRFGYRIGLLPSQLRLQIVRQDDMDGGMVADT